MRSSLLFGGALLAAAGLYLASRTQRGQVVFTDAIEDVIVSGRAIASALLPRGFRNNNPGNIDFIANPKKAWRGQVGSDGRFGRYDTLANGVRAIGQELLLDGRRGINTIKGLIGNWAPPKENNTAAYVVAVARALDVEPDEALNVPGSVDALVAAIINHENGGMFGVTIDDIHRWVRA